MSGMNPCYALRGTFIVNGMGTLIVTGMGTLIMSGMDPCYVW